MYIICINELLLLLRAIVKGGILVCKSLPFHFSNLFATTCLRAGS
jgi:hypothetical protein